MAYVQPHGKSIKAYLRWKGGRKVVILPFSPTATNLKAAAKQCAEAVERLKNGANFDDVKAWLRGDEPTKKHKQRKGAKMLHVYAQHFLDNADVKQSTAYELNRNYERHWGHWGYRSIDSISRMEIQDAMSAIDLSVSSKKDILSVLSQIFDVALHDGDIDANPCANWKFRKQQKPEIIPYTADERDALLKAMQPREAYRVFYTYFHSGMRTGELHALDWDHLDAPEIIVEHNRVRSEITTVKTNYLRRVHLHQGVWDVINEIPRPIKGGYVFLRPNGLPHLTNIWMMRCWHEAHKAAGVDLRPGGRYVKYPWRHTYISLALAQGVDPWWLCQQTGHDYKTMMENYARFIPGRLERSQEQLDKMYRE